MLTALGIALMIQAGPLRAASALSLRECLDLARKHAVGFAQAQANVKQAEAAESQAQSRLFPQLSAQGSLDFSDTPSTQLPDANKAVAHAEQDVYPFGPGWNEVRTRGFEAEAARRQSEAAGAELEFQVKQVYFELARDRDNLVLLDKVESTLKELRSTVLPRFSPGRAPSFDLVKVRSSLNDLTDAREQIEAEIDKDRLALGHLINMPPDGFETQFSGNTLPAWTAQANGPEGSAEVQAAEANLRARQSSLEGARWSRLPSLGFAAEYGLTGAQYNDQSLGWDLALAAKLPLLDWGLVSAEIRNQEAAAEASRLAVKAAKLAATEAWQASLLSARGDQHRRERALGLLPEAQRAAEAAIRRYRRGAMTIVEVSDAISLWESTYMAERSSFFACLTDLARLEQLSRHSLLDGYE